MAGTVYSPEELFELGRKNYGCLVSCCDKLEKGGFWNQARSVMKQSSTQVLDLYVQSVLLSLADFCGAVGQAQQEYILNITDTNPLELPVRETISPETVQYARKTAKLPPILIQLCDVYDRQTREYMAAEFVDTLFNVMLCMADLGDREEQHVRDFFREFYQRASMFVRNVDQRTIDGDGYILQKLHAGTIRSGVQWMLEPREQSRQSAAPEGGAASCQSSAEAVPGAGAASQQSRQSAAPEEGAASCQSSVKAVPGAGAASQQSLQSAAPEEGAASCQSSVEAVPGAGAASQQSRQSAAPEEGAASCQSSVEAVPGAGAASQQSPKETGGREETERLRLEEEQERLAAEQRRIEEERLRLEEEQRLAREEFQKVKKRLQERERAEREAQEKRLAELLAELNELVGLKSVKEEIRSLVNLIKVRRMRERMNMPAMDMSYHMVFTGSPGTGKTTVARLVAKIYKELGILSEGQLIETDRSRLVAGYVGQTAINVREIVEQAIGGVLFIDEAYALVSPDTANDFGSEAVDTLVKLMEDHRDDLVVIVAGYTEEMKVFLKSNTGLISRFNKFIAFDDYTQEQLLDILEVMVRRCGLLVEKDAVAEVGVRLGRMTAEERRDFGNARGVRNIFEKMIMNQANRLVTLEEPTRDQLMTLTREDAILV